MAANEVPVEPSSHHSGEHGPTDDHLRQWSVHPRIRPAFSFGSSQECKCFVIMPSEYTLSFTKQLHSKGHTLLSTKTYYFSAGCLRFLRGIQRFLHPELSPGDAASSVGLVFKSRLLGTPIGVYESQVY